MKKGTPLLYSPFQKLPKAAYGRLRQTEPRCGAANAALGEHRIEDQEEVEVEVRIIHNMNIFYSRYLLEGKRVRV
jgi:hypothetical protein